MHLVELTEQGESAFHRLRKAAADFDLRQHTGITDAELSHLDQLLGQLGDNVSVTRAPAS